MSDIKNDDAIAAARTAIAALDDAIVKVEQVDVVTAAQAALDVAHKAITTALDVAIAADQLDLAAVIAEQADKVQAIDIKTRSPKK